MSNVVPLTGLLQRAQAGDAEAADALFRESYFLLQRGVLASAGGNGTRR